LSKRDIDKGIQTRKIQVHFIKRFL